MLQISNNSFFQPFCEWKTDKEEIKTPPPSPQKPKESPKKICKWRVRKIDEGEIALLPRSPIKRKMEESGLFNANVVYRMKNLFNKKEYIGSTNNLEKRLKQYETKVNQDKSKTHIENALRINPKGFELSVVMFNQEKMPEKELRQIEENWIKERGSWGKGYNHSWPTQEPERWKPRKSPSPISKPLIQKDRTPSERRASILAQSKIKNSALYC